MGAFNKFVTGESFSMTVEDEDFFSTQGYPNINNYPLEYWALKLRSNWIRDNFYKLDLKKDPLYGLVEVPIAKNRYIKVSNSTYSSYVKLDTERDGVVVAGGAALYLSGYTHTCNDVDLFPLDKEKSLSFFKSISDSRYRQTVEVTKNAYNACNAFIDNTSNQLKLSLIRRLYSTPTEVVHGFDIDACQFVAVYTDGVPKLYATEIALYAAKNNCSWFDPNLNNATYIDRLIKYHYRGMLLQLPNFEHARLNTDLMADARLSSCMIETMSVYGIRETDTYKRLPKDSASKLIYTYVLGSCRRYTSSMYKGHPGSFNDTDEDKDSDINWDKEWMNPPITPDNKPNSAIHPEPYTDAITYYSLSPLYE